MTCPFCAPPQDRVAVDDCPLTRILNDAFPVTPGHLLVTPRRHVARWTDATTEERGRLIEQTDRARAFAVAADPTIEGFNIGWNDGAAAGQTIMHLHVHVIPRRTGDVEDPRGGIRWIMPAKARYWSP